MARKAADEPLVVEVVRSGVVESVHLADLAVPSEPALGAGDPDTVAYLRSAAKPLQALASIEAGWRPRAWSHLAVACGSHRAQDVHLTTVRAILEAAGLDETELAVPLEHNCSGKHAAMLAACVQAGWPREGYLDSDHPLQKLHLAKIASTMGCEPVTGVDGCGAWTYAAPLHALARAFSKVAGTEAAHAMLAHPVLVSGTNRPDTIAAEAGVLTKGGAEGLQCAVVNGRAFAFKVRDGSYRAVGPLLAEVVAALGGPDLRERLSIPVTGGAGVVGYVRVR